MSKIYLYLNSRDELLRIDVSRIVYFEADGNYTNIVSANGLKSVVCINLAHIYQLLNDKLKEGAGVFVRTGKSHIINLSYVYKINPLAQTLVLSDEIHFSFSLNVSKDALKKLKESYIDV